MSKHMKKLISTLLCGAMLLSSISVFAEGTDTAEATATEIVVETTETAAEATAEEATEAAEETVVEAPEATVAPVATAAPAADDEYFNGAIGLLSALKIFEGYEDGSIKPESTITRAEMAAVILRTLGNKSLTKYTGMFSDVDASHWAADTIQTAADLGIINGMGDGTFAPDAPVKYEQAIKMTVCALNYGAYAEYNGGYPMGYITLAGRNDLQLTKSIGGAYGTDATRGTVVKLIYNAINAPYPTLTGFDAMGPVYSTADDKTLASEKHDVYIGEGILTATPNKAIDTGASLLDTQIAIDGDVYESTITNADELVGQYIKVYYYDPTGNGGEETVIYATPVLNKNSTLTVDALKIDKFEDMQTKTPELKYYTESGSKKTAKLVEDPIIVYNNEVLTGDKIPPMPVDEETKEPLYGSDEAYLADFITPDVGSVKLGDFDNDGKYDIVFVEKYMTYVVNSSSTSKITFKYEVDGHKNMDVDLEDSQYTVNVTRDGEEIKPRHLKENQVLSILMNAPYMDDDYNGDKIATIVASTATLTGSASSFDEDDDGNYLTYVDGKMYYVDAAAADDVRDAIGNEATFYLDQFDRIAYIESASTGKLTGKEKYGWIMNVYVEDGADAPSIKLFTQDGNVEIYEVDSEIDYWDKNGHESDFNTSENQDTLLSLKKVSAYERLGGSGASIRLCKYKVNSENLITKLYIADATDDKKAVTVDTTSMKNKPTAGTTLDSKYNMSGDVLEFQVPDTEADMTDVASYKVSTIAGTTYFDYENGASETFVVAEFDGKKPGVIVRYNGSADLPANANDYDTAGDNSVMMVTKVSKAIDEDDETVYVVKGFVGAGEVQYTTKTTSVLRDMAKNDAAANQKSYYTGTDVWDGKSGDDLREVLQPGDICGVHGNGDIFVRMVSVDKVASDVVAGVVGASDQFYGTVRKSATRDDVTFNAVNSVDIDSTAAIDIGGVVREVAIDAAVVYAEVSINGDSYTVDVAEETMSVFDIEEFDLGSKEGDFVFKRLFKNGAERETYVIRFVD